MSPISLILNILWILFGGLMMCAGWLVAGLIMAITVIGLPWASVAFRFAFYVLLPFGRRAVAREQVSLRDDDRPGVFGLLRNLIWLVLAGWWLALGHLASAIFWAITIIGLPFAWAHFKLAAMAIWPVGKTIVTTEEVDEALRLRFRARMRGGAE